MGARRRDALFGTRYADMHAVLALVFGHGITVGVVRRLVLR